MLRAAVAAAFGVEHADTDPLVSPTNNPKFGDYQANLAMPLAKKLGQPPREVAAAIIEHLKDDAGLLAQAPGVAGPGFINFFVSNAALAENAASLLADDRLGVPTIGSPQTVVVDYSSPNVAKEMHVGHLRSTVIGDAIARILDFQGHVVIRQNHVGDWGTQFGMLIEHLLETGSGDDTKLGDLTALYKTAKKRFDAEPDFAERAKQRVVKLQGGDADTLAVWEKLVEQSNHYFASIYTRMGILLEPGDTRGESFYNDKLAGVVERLEQQGALAQSQGAKVVYVDGFTDREGEPLPMIVQKSDGGYLYATTDLAAAAFRADELNADRIVYVVGQPQRQHFDMLFATLRKLGWAKEDVRLDYVPFGSVLGEDKKMFKTRSGETVRLVDLLDEAEQRASVVVSEKSDDLVPEQAAEIGRAVGIGALKYADLSSDRIKDYVFSWDRMLALDGNTAPYLVNAYVRIASIFRKAELDMAGYSAAVRVDDEYEKALVLKLLQFAGVVEVVAESLEPHRLCTYLYELASLFHKFYEHCPVLRSDVAEDVRASRLGLCKLVGDALERGLGLLGIGVVERM